MTLGLALPPATDLSGEPTSSLTETALIRGYAAGPALLRRVERCACGGTIRALDAPRAITYAVEVHNGSTRHAHWRAWRDAD